MTFLPLTKGDGLDEDRLHKRSDVAVVQALINRAFGTMRLIEDGVYGVNMSSRIVELGIQDSQAGPDTAMGKGELFTGSMFGRLIDKVHARL